MTRTKFTEEEIQEMIRLYREENWTQDNVAKRFDSTRKVIRKYLINVKRLFEDETWLREQYEVNRLNKREIAKLANTREMTIHKYMKLYNIEVDHTISRQRKYKQDDDFFSVIDTEEKAYWLGFIVADGGVHYDPLQETGYYRLTIQLKKSDDLHLRKFIQSINGTMEVKYGETTLAVTGKTYGYSKVIVYSKKMVEDLISLRVVPNKSTREAMPPIQEHLMRHFIRGLFDGDGCFSYYLQSSNQRHYACFSIVGSYDVLNAVKIFLESKGFTLRICEEGKIYNLRATSTQDSVALLDYLEKDATIYLDRKYNKLQEWYNLSSS